MKLFNQKENGAPLDTSVDMSAKEARDYIFPPSIMIAAFVLTFAWIYSANFKAIPRIEDRAQDALQNESVNEGALVIPLAWKDLGPRMIKAGVIDEQAFNAIYTEHGGLTREDRTLLTGTSNDKIIVNQKNAGFVLNFLWAFGLGNKNPILEHGPMTNPRYGGTNRFASTGGWTIANGDVMNHYSAHSFVVLTGEQQEIVERISKNIYRPCCDNAAYFPDCNHGMAMLGLLELLAAENISEQTIYKTALRMNTFWFPNQYQTIAQYLQKRGQNIENRDPKEILGENYSSASGYRAILQAVGPQAPSNGENCGIGSSSGKNQTAPQLTSSDCGV